MNAKVNVTSADIIRLLSAKHAKDIIVPECKNGQTWFSKNLLKLDAWVLCRTYSPLTTIGYEVKVSRHDFETDRKWISYPELCHEFYFVCPAGLIRAIDLPKGIGLIWTMLSGERLHTKIKAERHQPDLEKLMDLLLYVLMSRVVIVKDMNEANKGGIEEDRLKLIADRVKSAEDRKELDSLIKGHIRTRYEEMEKRAREAEYVDGRVSGFVEHLARLGITWNPKRDMWMDDQRVRNEIDLLGKRVNDFTLRAMKNLSKELLDTVSEIEKLRNRDNALKKEQGD